MGDPAGVGPELTLKALASPQIQALNFHPVIFGDLLWLQKCATDLSIDIKLDKVNSLDDATDGIPVLASNPLKTDQITWGATNPELGQASLNYVQAAVELALEGKLDAVVTGPIAKVAWLESGSEFAGHTELLDHQCRTEGVMMLLNDWLRVALVTHHLPLQKIFSYITQEKVYHTIEVCGAGMKQLGVEKPHLAVAGLNPHAGENGNLGQEEIEIIEPAIGQARNAGIEVSGPFPADTVFHRALQGEFDAVIAMHHDQGLPPLKTIGFAETVNVTLGLPIIRTSVGHGTAFDLAGKNRASPVSMIKAIETAVTMAENR